MANLRSLRHRRRATYLVEFAVAATVFFLFLFGVIEYGRLLMTRHLLDNAAREGARYAVVNTSTAQTSDVQNTVDHYLVGAKAQLTGYNKTTSIEVFMTNGVTAQPVDANGNAVSSWTQSPWNSATFGQPIMILVTGTYQPFFPNFLFLGKKITLQSSYVMYCEAN